MHHQLLTAAAGLGVQSGKIGLDSVEVLGIIGADADLQQPPQRRLGNGELLATVEAGKAALLPVR
jgi:hypothetical protein